MAAIRAAAPALRLTVDPVEFRGFRYETGVSVTVYAPGRHEELGRGGRYICGDSEPATGVTLYPDAILRAEGFATVAALAPVDDDAAEARRLGCSHILRAGKAAPLHSEG